MSGSIPTSLTSLNSLTFMSLQHNNLSGPVPTLLARKFNSSSFVGSVQLCGYSPSTQCSSPAPSEGEGAPSEVSKYRHHKKLGTKDIILLCSRSVTCSPDNSVLYPALLPVPEEKNIE